MGRLGERYDCRKRDKVIISREDVVSYEEFAYWLKGVRKTLGMTQQDLADALGVPVINIRRYEAAEYAPQDPYIFVGHVRSLLQQQRRKRYEL